VRLSRVARLLFVVACLTCAPRDASAQGCTLSAPYPTIRTAPVSAVGLLPLSATGSCPTTLTVSSTAPWLHADSGSVSSNGAFVSFNVEANTTGAARTAIIVVNGQALITFTQGTASCVSSVAPVDHAFPVSGGTLSYQVQTTAADCFWSVTGFPPPPLFSNPFAPGWVAHTGANSYGLTGNFNAFDIGSRSFEVTAQSNAFNSTARSATLTFGGGPSATVTQPAPTCQFTFSPASVTMPANGGTATVNLTGTGTDCTYTAAPAAGSSWVTVTAGASGTAPATVTISVAANNTSAERTGRVIAVNGVLSITQAGPPIAVDFGNTFGGIGFGAARRVDGTVRVTSPEPIRVTNTVEPTASWNATVSQSWIVVTPSSGTTPATMRIAIDPVAMAAQTPGFLTGSIDIFSSTAPQTPRRITVNVNYYNGIPGSQPGFVFGAAPFGWLDSPAEGATGLAGAVPITGWAIDRVGLTNVRIYRNAVGGEAPGLVYVGDALRVFGARPDLLMFYAAFPEARIAGFGYMLLSNVLPGNGNGTFTFSAYAEDVDGNNTLIGSKTVTFDNAHAVKPFGTIDDPAQGQTVSGTMLNRGWALTPQPKAIPFDGSTIKVYIDGVLLSGVSQYNRPRPDVKAVFPGLANSDGPEARLSIDTTTLADGVHTIAWAVTDDAGVAEGIGSRYFTVLNGASSLVWDRIETSRSAAAVAKLAIVETDVWSRQGVDDGGWATRVETDAKGNRTLHATRGQRVELFLDPTLAAPCGTWEGHQLTGEVAGPLPMGASLDAGHGIFRWQPGTAVSGRFDFAFVQRGCDNVERQIPLRVVIADEKTIRGPR
jgi:hypothetical protein